MNAPQCPNAQCGSKHTHHISGSKWRCLDCDESFKATELVLVAPKLVRRLFGWMKEHAPPVQAWATTFAILIGGWWTYNRFVNQETEVSNPNISITTETIKYTDRLRLLSVHVHPTNQGKTLITVCKNGLILSLKKIPPQHQPRFIDLAALPDIYHLTDLANYSGGYEIEPGITYDETRVFTVEQGDVYAIRAEIDYSECKNPNDEIDVTSIVKID